MHLSGLRRGCADFWLPVEAGKNRSFTTTSPCKSYPLPSEQQGPGVAMFSALVRTSNPKALQSDKRMIARSMTGRKAGNCTRGK